MIDPTNNEICLFKMLVNAELSQLDLEDEAIDDAMAETYLVYGYSVQDAVDDVCAVLETVLD